MRDSLLSNSNQVEPASVSDGSTGRESSPRQTPAVVGRHAWRAWRNTLRDRWRSVLFLTLGMTAVLGVLVFAVTTVAVTPLQQLASVLIAAIVLAVMITAVIDISARRVRDITKTVDRIARGQFSARVETFGPGDIGQLGNAVNRMAQRLAKQSRKRKRERDRLHTVLHTMSDGILMLNRHGEVRMINPAAGRILHVDINGSLDRSFVQVVRDHRIAEVWTRCKENGSEQTASIELTSDLYVRVSVTPFLKGSANGYVVLLQDLSHQHHLETVRRDFVSNLSHELRTPLASVKALVDTLRDGALEDPPAAEHFLQRMEIEVDEMTQMVQELLELSRIESGQVPLRVAPVDARLLIEPAVERLHPQADRAQVTLSMDLPDAPIKVMADADRIRGVLVNLLHNAIKFTPAGGKIDVRVVPGVDTVCFSVVDTGVGIPSEDVGRIFERFYKSDRARSSGGTGLGLAIAKHTIQAHDGVIWAESVEGEGSTFTFELPQG